MTLLLNGYWVVQTYDVYATYPVEAYIFLFAGLLLILFSLLLKHAFKNTGDQTELAFEPNRLGILISSAWRDINTAGAKLLYLAIIILAILYIVDRELVLPLIGISFFIGILLTAFFYILSEQIEENEKIDLQPESEKIRALLNLIDYRKKAFSIPLVLHVAIILSILVTKEFEIVLEMQIDSMYAWDLKFLVLPLSGLVLACGLLFVMENWNFLGIRRRVQGDYKLMAIHFAEIIVCGAGLFIWLMTLLFPL